jgi:hypothetical protein
MKPIIKYSVIVVLALVLVLLTINKTAYTEKQTKTNNKIQYVVSVSESPLMNEIHKIKLEKKIENKRYEIKDVNLDKELLDYIWNSSKEANFSYELILAFIKQESDMGKDKVNYNHNGTKDFGITQINSNSVKWLGDLADLKNPDPMNDYHSIKMTLAYLVEERDFWRKQGLSEEQVFFATVLTYNRGRSGAISYIRRNGWNSKYVENILNYKSQFEQNIIEE